MRQAAAEAGVSLSTMSRVESGSLPDLASFTALCAWAGVSPSRFFTPIAERQDTHIEVAIAHLSADPRLSAEHASSIASVIRQMYDALAAKAEPAAPPGRLPPAGSVDPAAGGARPARGDHRRPAPGAGTPRRGGRPAVSLPRGFKANAERESLRLRRELGLAPTQALDVTRLAGHLGVEIISAGDLIDVTRLEELERIQAYSFSAATFEVAGRTFVVTSPLRPAPRQASDIAHELSHLRAQARAVRDPRDQRRALPHLPARRGRAGD